MERSGNTSCIQNFSDCVEQWLILHAQRPSFCCWFLKETHGAVCGFILFTVISTAICLEQQIKPHQCLFSVYPGGVLRSLESRLPFVPLLPNSNVNSFCQQIKVDLLAVSWALIPSILLASITLSEVIIPCHLLFHAWEAPGVELSTWRLPFLVQI